MPLRLRLLCFLLVSLAWVAAFPGAAPAAAARAATFVFGGTIAEPGGRPIRGAKVLLRGVLDPAARSDAEGRFSFSYVVPDMEALASAPLQLVLGARHRNWNLALPTGEGALAVELRLVRPADGTARLEVRSNDAAVAKAVAASFDVPGDATIALRAAFMRQRGAEDRSEPKWTALETVAAPAPVVVPTAPAAVRTTSTSAPAPVVAPPAPAPVVALLAPAPRADTVRAAPAVPAPRRRPERPGSLSLFPSAPEPGSVRKPAPARGAEPARAPVVTPAPASPPADSLGVRRATRAGVAASAPPVVVREIAGPRVVTDTAATPVPGIRVSVRPDTLAPAPRGAGSTAPGAGALRVALGRAVAAPDLRDSTGRPCECEVEGTVEVSADRSLHSTLQVVVSLAGMPARCDTVALFMGPPRPFDLGRVPCGSHRLEVRPLSSRLFKVAAPALDAFDCGGGRLRQFRVVLTPQ